MQKSETGDNQQAKVTEIEKSWLAGIIDGEGSIRIDYPRVQAKVAGSAQPGVVITNTDWAIIEKSVDICQRIGVNPHVSKRHGTRLETKDVLVLGMPKIMVLLTAVMPYLTGNKSKQAILLYRFCEQRKQLDVNSLANRDRAYTQEQINIIWEIKQIRHSVTEPQRLNARPEREDIVRTV
jgi:hypothetical protein